MATLSVSRWLPSMRRRKQRPASAPPLVAASPERRSSATPRPFSTLSPTSDIFKSISEANCVSQSAAAGSLSKQCICCGTRLSVPQNVDCFKCGVCGTLTDLKVTSTTTNRRPVIDIEGTIAALREPREAANVQALLDALFFDADSVRAAFSIGQHRAHHSRPDIDYAKVGEFYAAVAPGATTALMKATVRLLKRPRKPLAEPLDCCFLLVVLENPHLQPGAGECASAPEIADLASTALEHIMGIMTHVNRKCRGYLLEWLSYYYKERFQPKVELMNAYLSRRLSRGFSNSAHKHERHGRGRSDPTRSSRHAGRTAGRGAAHREPPPPPPPPPSVDRKSSKKKRKIKPSTYVNDWRAHVAVRALQLLFEASSLANNKVPLELFYNSVVDCVDVVADFDSWQRAGTPEAGVCPVPLSTDVFASADPVGNEPRFALCQYPFLLSIGSKTRILEYDAKVQMELKAQEAFFGSLASKEPHIPHLYVRIRREHILPDSFESLRTNGANLKKSLRVQFLGEPGIDEGGLKKEWLLLLLRELFDPKQKIFVEDDESRYSWFDTAATASLLDYYHLTGIAIGLAVYNSIILDIGLPPVVFKKLLGKRYTLEDFRELKPSLGRGLKAMLNYQGDDFEEVFGLNFTVSAHDESGTVRDVPLIAGGATTAVTKENRRHYVQLIMAYFLDKSVAQPFDAFKRGFYTVVGGNALTLFRPEELSRLVCGSFETLDVDTLRAVTRYQHWGTHSNAEAEKINVVHWFWRFFKSMSPDDQRKLLTFVTGTDRIPATGISTLPFRIAKLGDDSDRLPTSHTCFNQLCLYTYSSEAKLRSKLKTAIDESQGFGIK